MTDRRILFLSDRGQSVERVGFDEIASVSARVGGTGGELMLSPRGGKTRKFNFMEPKIRATEMGDLIAHPPLLMGAV